MADPWDAFPDAPKMGFVREAPSDGMMINMGGKPGDAWAAFPDAPPPVAPTPGRTAARLGGQFAQNTNDALADTVAAPFDLAAAVTNKLGLSSGPSPVGPAIKSGIDYLATAPGRVSDAVSQGSLGPLTDSRTSRFNPATTGEAAAAGAGQFVGNALSVMAPAGVIAKSAKAGTMTQGLAATLASQPKTQLAAAGIGGAVGGATDNPYLGLATSLAVPLGIAGARRVASPVTNRLSSQEQEIAKFAKAEGVPLTPAQSTGSPALRGLEETMARLPFGGGPMQGAYAKQRAAFNKSTLSRAGITAEDASPETLTKAFRSQGQTFDDLASRTTVNLDNKFVSDLVDTAQNYGRRLPTDIAPVFKSYLDDLEGIVQAVNSGQKPQLLGDAYKKIRSDMTDRIRGSNDGDLKRALGGLVNALDGAMERSAKGSLAGEWKEARRQYQALMTIDKAMVGGTQADRSAGNIPFSALKSATVQGDKAGFSRGRGQMNEPARLADFLSTRVPNSGTPERLMWANLLSGGSLMGGGGVAAAGGFTPAALAAAAGTAAAPAIASRLYNTGLAQKYLTNQAAGRTDLKGLYGAQGVNRGLDITPREQPTALARALMRANEKRAAR